MTLNKFIEMEQSTARRYLDKISEYLTELKNDKR